ncbi:MAG: pyridoxal phosphate-dependent aminotransferase [Acidobacteriota bacterium]
MSRSSTYSTSERPRFSVKVGQFTESVIREMTRKALEHDAINLAQGFPDFPAADLIKKAAVEAVEADLNQYAITWGAQSIRRAIAAKLEKNGIDVDPERELTVTCGATEAMIATLLALINPGDEVVVFEPFYENYGPDTILAGATPRFVPLEPPTWEFDTQALRAAFNKHTKAIILNTPNNPTGKVFSDDDLQTIADCCIEHNVVAVTDEIYEHLIYSEPERPLHHRSLITLDGMRDRTVVINGMSKTYSVTGWRVGWTVAAADITAAIRKVHDFLTVGAAAPLQEAGAVALALPDNYYEELCSSYRKRRDMFCSALAEAGLRVYVPDGAYYVITDIGDFGYSDDLTFTDFLVREIGVAVVPGSSFYSDPERGSRQIRFAFCKQSETLQEAAKRLQCLRA